MRREVTSCYHYRADKIVSGDTVVECYRAIHETGISVADSSLLIPLLGPIYSIYRQYFNDDLFFVYFKTHIEMWFLTGKFESTSEEDLQLVWVLYLREREMKRVQMLDVMEQDPIGEEEANVREDESTATRMGSGEREEDTVE